MIVRKWKRCWLGLLLVMAMFVTACAKPAGGDLPEDLSAYETIRQETQTKENAAKETTETTETTTEALPEPVEVDILMIGDMLLHWSVQKSRVMDDGSYNYDHFFQDILEDVAEADLAVVNQEVIIGGKEIGMQNYPTFNCVEEVSDAIVKAGFDVTLHATNHTWDQGEKGVRNCIAIWKERHPEEIVLGIHDSEEEADTLTIWEKDGFKIALLNYTYSLNGFRMPQGKEYLVDLLEKERVISDIRRGKALADCVVVFPHWGTEYRFEPDDYQKEWAQLFADEGVTLVLGAHPHVIEPIEWVEGKDGDKTLVYYSVGNYISAQDKAYSMLGAMAKVTLVKEGNGEVWVKEYSAEPLVTQRAYGVGAWTTYKLENYTEELAKKNHINKLDSRFSIAYLEKLWDQVMGE